ncbi:aminocarboxymuconate-semialdehyde decarboxylase [Streptomyces sp. NRRL F-4489]|uniref:amidohydrolase family protein n=1 Tax=Streptomyces sp. NRRL F-4489 TaxID=1609095 RepID=UPI00074A1EF4|nr:amidohydrolase family protein [Streptomyces sp. NRRL F-4489]KUL45998.1 aminocarboxymuconate-semialdehyde decarboxylase [Streptomyces sp. NRRL F-4489]
MTVVDVHAHVFPRVSRAESRILHPEDGPWLREDGGGAGMMMSGTTAYRPVGQELWDPEPRLRQMDRQGVDIQVVSSTPLMFGYAADPGRATQWCELVNDRVLQLCAHAPDRLVPLCQVPLQDTELACAEVSRAMAAGHAGVHLGNHVGDRGLDDGPIREFLAHCAHENAPVFVHPWDMLAPERMPRYMLPWLVGMAAETQLTLLGLCLSGAFEQLPESLRLCFAHGGGSFPYLLGRADNAWHRRDLVRADSPRPPSAYLDRFHLDSAVFDPRAFRLLVEVMGPERIMLGTDYPFPLGEERHGALVRDSHLTPAERALVLGGNALRFFGLDAPRHDSTEAPR